MAIGIPTHADSTRYAYASDVGGTSITFAANAIPSTNIAEGDHLVVFIHKDDNAGGAQTAPSGWTKWYEFIDAGGDDSTAVGYYHEVTAAEASSGSAAVTFTMGESEEIVARMIHITGAHDTDFDDSVTPATYDHQDTNSPDPAQITTNTDGAVVIAITGNRTHARHLGAAVGTLVWNTSPPSGYTIESQALADYDENQSQSNVAAGAPGRHQQGTGNGDAQMTWAHYTKATAGVENPGAFAGFQSTRDHKVVTVAIRPKPTGTNYDETGRSVSVTATVAATDTLTHHYTENRTAAVTATVTGTDQADFTDDVATSIAATVTATDDRTLTDENVSVAITSSVAATDAHNLYYDETGRTVSVAATVTASDVQHYAVDGLTVAVTASVAATDDRTLTDENVVVAIIATVDATDVEPGVNYDETGRVVNIIGAVAATDDHNIAYDETGRVVAITATVTATDDRTLTAENVTVAATSNVTSSDTADYTDAVTVAVTAAVFGSDQLTTPGAYEEDVSVAIAATVTGTDTADFSDALTVAVTGAVAATDAWATSEDVSVAISSSVAPTDQFDATEAVAVAVVGSTAASDVVSSVEALSVPVTATVNATDDYTPTEQLVEDVSVTITSSVAATDLAAYVEAGVVDIVATIAATDSETEDYGENVTVAIVSTVTAGDTARLMESQPFITGPTATSHLLYAHEGNLIDADTAHISQNKGLHVPNDGSKFSCDYSTEQPLFGAGSLKFVVIVAGSSPSSYQSERTFPVTPAATYTFSMETRPSKTATGRARIQWRDSGGSVISDSYGDWTDLPANEWTRTHVTAVAPTGAATCFFMTAATITSGSVPGDVVYQGKFCFKDGTDPTFRPSHRMRSKQIFKYKLASSDWTHPTNPYAGILDRYSGSTEGYVAYVTQAGSLLHGTYDNSFDHVLGTGALGLADDVGTWHEVESWVDPSTGEYEFWVDGVLVAEGTDTPNPWTVQYDPTVMRFLRNDAKEYRLEYFEVWDGDDLRIVDLRATDAPGVETDFTDAEWTDWVDSAGNLISINAGQESNGYRTGGEASREVNIIATVVATDGWNTSETAVVAITSSVASTDDWTQYDDVLVAITSAISSTDIFDMVDPVSIEIISAIVTDDIGAFVDASVVPVQSTVGSWDNWYMLLEHDTAGIGTASGETEPNRAVSDDELADAVGGERGTATSNLPRPGRVT